MYCFSRINITFKLEKYLMAQPCTYIFLDVTIFKKFLLHMTTCTYKQLRTIPYHTYKFSTFVSARVKKYTRYNKPKFLKTKWYSTYSTFTKIHHSLVAQQHQDIIARKVVNEIHEKDVHTRTCTCTCTSTCTVCVLVHAHEMQDALRL